VPGGVCFAFDSFELDPAGRRLTAAGQPLAISDRQLDVLHLLVARAGQIVSKDDLLQVGWKDVAVGDNSLEQVISSLRRLLGSRQGGVIYIETVPRRGYRFDARVTRTTTRESDASLDALLAPHRAFIEGRAALETLEADRVARAREVFERSVRITPEYASAHVGLANAGIMQFEMTRTDPAPDSAALALAERHAREACRLDPHWGEAWATLGFVLDRAGQSLDARAAAKRAVALEPDNWRHHFRLAFVSWGEERLGAAQRTLALLPDFPLAHWLAATVHVARRALNEAERELAAGLAAPVGGTRFSPVALHWLRGLILLERGDDAGALAAFDRELALEDCGQLYARECAANAWYATGALRLQQGDRVEAAAAFARATERVPAHPLARVGLAACGSNSPDFTPPLPLRTERPAAAVEGALVQAARLTVDGDHDSAAQLLDAALTNAPPGNAGWLLPVEPLLRVSAHRDIWAHVLAQLRNRAA